MLSRLSALCGCISGFGDVCPWQQTAGRRRAAHHLHSTASTFWGGDDEEGLIPVSDEADDIEAPACDTVESTQPGEIKK